MATPLRTQLFDAFLGQQDGIHSIILPDVFSSGGSKNLYIDKYGRAKKIDGYSKANAEAVTTDTGGSATMLRSLVHYRKTDSGSLTNILLGAFDDQTDEFEIKSSTNQGSTWSHITDLGSGSVDSIPDWAQFGDTIYFTNGVIAPASYDGSSWATAGRTQSPTVSSAAAGVAGALTGGQYQWKLVSIIDGELQAGSAPSTVLELEDDQGSLSWTADSDTNVDGYELYRTTATGKVYYFVDYIDGRTTTSYTDNTPDADILENRVLAEHGDPPPSGAYYCEPHKQRMWWARTDANPARAYWSDSGLPEDVLGDNYLDFTDGETIGDRLVGLLGNFEGRLVLFTERAIWTVSGTGQIIGDIPDWSRTRTNAQTGSISGKTVARVPAGAKFPDQLGEVQTTDTVTLAYLTPFGDIRLFDGDNDVIISNPVQTKLRDHKASALHKSFVLVDPERGEISWFIPFGSSATEPTSALVWNFFWGVWYEREWPFACATAIEDSNDVRYHIAGEPFTTTGGYAYTLWDGDNFDGANIEAIWMTKTLFGINSAGQPALSQTKRWRWVDFIFESAQATALVVEWLPSFADDDAAGEASATLAPGVATLLSVDGDTIQSNDGDDLVVSEESTILRALLKDGAGRYHHDVGIRLRVGDNAALGSWSLEAMNLAYQILPGLGRRMP